MGWSIHYEVSSRDGGPMSQDDCVDVEENVRQLNEALHDGCEHLQVRLKEERTSGFAKIHYSTKDTDDFVLIVEGFQAFARDRCHLRIMLADDYYLQGQDALEIGNVREIVGPSAPSDGIY